MPKEGQLLDTLKNKHSWIYNKQLHINCELYLLLFLIQETELSNFQYTLKGYSKRGIL